MKADVVVLGAGIVGISVAIHLQDRGRKVVLLDRRDPGEEASHGNAGLIQSASVIPYGFPRDPWTVARYASNRCTALRYDPASLPAFAPWLYRYWRESAPERLARAGRDMLPLIRASTAEHLFLARRAGLQPLLREGGWLEAIRSGRLFERQAEAARALSRDHGLELEVLDGQALLQFDPVIREGYAGALHWCDPLTVSNPGELAKGYARLFECGGGRIVKGDASTLCLDGRQWSLQSGAGRISAGQMVLALGAWSDVVFRPLGYRIPLMPKRGYHMHYEPAPGRGLRMPVIDVEQGYAVAPMQQGVRISTGVELVRRDAPPGMVQLLRAERSARPVFGLGARLDAVPWHGMRPCIADMRPVMGPAARHPGLWFCFGHNHHGFTLGPCSGRLLAELMTGADTFADAAPFRPDRF